MAAHTARPPASADHELSWTLQRLAWLGGVVVLTLAVAGVLGGESPSRRRAAAPDGSITLEYDRFARAGNRVEFIIHTAGPPAGGTVTLDFHGATPRQLGITAIQPFPIRSESISDGVRLTLAAPGPGATVQITGRPASPGRARYAFSLPGLPGPPGVAIRQFVYP